MATDEELKALLGESPAEEAPPEGEPKDKPEGDAPKDPPEQDPEVKTKQEQLANLNKAVEEEKNRLRALRKERRTGKTIEEIEEDELPKINLEDPSAKAWDKRIRDAAAPAQQELEKAKEERRLFALRGFLEDKPHLAKSPEKLKAMMQTYDRLKTSSELTSEGITMDLERAYAAEHSEELIRAARNARMDGARNDAILSDIGVSRGSSTYSNEKEAPAVRLDEEERQILARWGMTPAQWMEDKKKFG